MRAKKSLIGIFLIILGITISPVTGQASYPPIVRADQTQDMIRIEIEFQVDVSYVEINIYSLWSNKGQAFWKGDPTEYVGGFEDRKWRIGILKENIPENDTEILINIMNPIPDYSFHGHWLNEQILISTLPYNSLSGLNDYPLQSTEILGTVAILALFIGIPIFMGFLWWYFTRKKSREWKRGEAAGGLVGGLFTIFTKHKGKRKR